MLCVFNDHNVEYMVVGAYAVSAHAEPRYTGDIDYWVNPTTENAKRVFDALCEFGAPLMDLTVDDLATEGTVYQIGIVPQRIDVITRISGVEFQEAWKDKVSHKLFGVSVYIPSIDHLIKNKKASARPKDLLDVTTLLKYKS